jgi:hypothetical protein
MDTYDNVLDIKDAPDKWKYGTYGYRYDSDDDGNWKKAAVAGALLGR